MAQWPTYHRDAARSGYLAGAPPAGRMSIRWRARLDGAVYASPLVIPDGVVAATENDSVYLLRDGRTVWRRHLGSPVALSDLPCGNVDPLGITGTPAYDDTTRTVYVVAELSGPIRHRLFALDAATGTVRWSRSVDADGMDPVVQQQRGALTIRDHATVYVPFGGLYGDCGDFHGWVVGSSLAGSGTLAVYRTPGTEGGIWTPPGLSLVGTTLFASVGNGGATGPPYDVSDSVVALDGALQRQGFFAPGSWAEDNAADLDLGSNGAQPVGGGLLVIAGKRGTIYLVSQRTPGGIGHPLASLTGCAAFGGSATVDRTVFLPCRDGVQAVRVAGGSLKRLWRASSNVTGSPVVGGGVVWSLDPAGTLYQLDQSTGSAVREIAVGPTSRFATPALAVDHRSALVIVPTLTGVVAVAGL